MRTVSLIVLLLGALATLGASPAGAAGQTATRSISVVAYADYNANPIFPLHGDASAIWIDSGFALKTGLPISVTATGTAYYYPDFPVGPEGIGGSCFLFCGGPGLSTYSLIGRVGNGQPFLVGRGPITLSGDGELYFAFNDGAYDDNSGSFSVTLSYQCEPDGGSTPPERYRCETSG